MKTPRVCVALLACACLLGSLQAAAPSDLAWPALTRENKPWTRWWWLGSAVDKPNLTRELETIAAAGFGGVEITPNRIRDLEKRGVAWKNFHEINFVNIFYQPFNGAGWPLQPSGLLGPVRLVPLQAFSP